MDTCSPCGRNILVPISCRAHVDEHAPLVSVVEAAEQPRHLHTCQRCTSISPPISAHLLADLGCISHRRLAASRRPHERSHRPRAESDGRAAERGLLRAGVRELHAVELDLCHVDDLTTTPGPQPQQRVLTSPRRGGASASPLSGSIAGVRASSAWMRTIESSALGTCPDRIADYSGASDQ